MSHVPSVLVVLDAEDSLELKGGYPLLGRGHEMESNDPLSEGNVGAAHHGSNGDGELLPAHRALPYSRARRAPFEFIRTSPPAVGADRSVWPTDFFKKVPCLCFCHFRQFGEIHLKSPFISFSIHKNTTDGWVCQENNSGCKHGPAPRKNSIISSGRGYCEMQSCVMWSRLIPFSREKFIHHFRELF